MSMGNDQKTMDQMSTVFFFKGIVLSFMKKKTVPWVQQMTDFL